MNKLIYAIAVIPGFALCLNGKAAEPNRISGSAVSVVQENNIWTLANANVMAKLAFRTGGFNMTNLVNLAAKRDYLAGRPGVPLFSYTVDGVNCAADDGKWTLAGSAISPIALYGKIWGKRLEITLSRTVPVAFSVKEVFEIYEGGAMRCLSYLGNETNQPLTVSASDIFALNLPNEPHEVDYVTGNLMWNIGTAGVHRGGRNAIALYATGDGWFLIPENNWATSLEAGPAKGDAANKLLYVYAWDGEEKVRVSTNAKAVQLTLFPHEELEWFSVDFGVFKGDAMDGRAAAAAHLRERFKFYDPSHILSTNDWQWGWAQNRRTDANYRNVAVPKAQAAGFDRVLMDDGWYAPDDSDTPTGKRSGDYPVYGGTWMDLNSFSEYINEHSLQTGYWFSLQGHFAGRGWANGRDGADPANVDFKLKQMEEDLIGKGRSTWDQVDGGLLWKTDKVTSYSHPGDSVYRKILGMKRYMNTIADKYPGFLMQTTCEVDNPAGPGGSNAAGEGNQNVGLIHLADGGITGMFRRTEYADDVRDAFAAFGLFPLEGLLATHGADAINGDAWQDSPMWYYQFLLQRHTMIYSWPGDWPDGSVQHMRIFNDWRKNPRIQAILNQGMLPVYNGPDAVKNEGPWCWMFTDPAKTVALVFAINHRDLNKNNAFDAKLRWLDEAKTYLVEEITQLPDGGSNYVYRGEFPGAELKAKGLPVNLDLGEEHCAAFFIQEKRGSQAQVLYADGAVAKYAMQMQGGDLVVQLDGKPNSEATLIVSKPANHGAEMRTVALNAFGKATSVFGAQGINQTANASGLPTITTNKGAHDTTTFGAWKGKYGLLAAWIAGERNEPSNGFSLETSAPVYVWGNANAVSRVLEQTDGPPGARKAACWTTGEQFSMRVNAAANKRYKLSVYFMDYDNGRRAMDIMVKSDNGAVCDRQSANVQDGLHGIYLSWELTGPATIKAKKTAGVNAAVSGVFVDPL